MGVVVSYPVRNLLDMPLPAVTKSDLVIFPTETVYGIGTFLSNEEGIERIYELKNREDKPISLHLAAAGDIAEYAEYVSPVAEHAASLYLPGPLLMIFKARKDLKISKRLLKNGKIGIRVFSNFIAASLVHKVGEPLVGTSANISGNPSPRSFFDVSEGLVDGCDYAFDNGPTLYQNDSTIVDFCEAEPVVLREGAISFDELSKVLSSKLRRLS